jgi:hypothetical protein
MALICGDMTPGELRHHFERTNNQDGTFITAR